VWLRGENPAVCGSGTGLWPGTAQRVESLAEQSSSSADLSQICLQLLRSVSGSGAHEVCSSVSISILDLLLYPFNICTHVCNLSS
jgi:hypothetical protein